MKETLEKLWDEYFAEKCAIIDTSEEKALAARLTEMRKELNKALTVEQSDAIEKYIESLYEIQGSFVKKAFFKGCELTVSFFVETGFFKIT